MGCYVNPSSMPKEQWLGENGIFLGMTAAEGIQELRWPPADGWLPVVLVDNGAFTAAGVAYSESEWRSFIDPLDRRFKIAYLVPIDKLLGVSDLGKFLPTL